MESPKAQHFSALVYSKGLKTKSPQAEHAETDPRHGTPTTAQFNPPVVSLFRIAAQAAKRAHARHLHHDANIQAALMHAICRTSKRMDIRAVDCPLWRLRWHWSSPGVSALLGWRSNLG